MTQHNLYDEFSAVLLALAKECYAMKLELLTNAMVVDDAIRFVYLHATASEKADADERLVIEGGNEIPVDRALSVLLSKLSEIIVDPWAVAILDASFANPEITPHRL